MTRNQENCFASFRTLFVGNPQPVSCDTEHLRVNSSLQPSDFFLLSTPYSVIRTYGSHSSRRPPTSKKLWRATPASSIQAPHPKPPMSEDSTTDALRDLIDTHNDLNASVIDELDAEPSPLEFMRYVARNTPFVIRGGALSWKASKKWDADYLRSALSGQTVNVAVTPEGCVERTLHASGTAIVGTCSDSFYLEMPTPQRFRRVTMKPSFPSPVRKTDSLTTS